MTIADYDQVYALWMSCKNMGFNDVDDSRTGIARLLDRNPGLSFVAMDGGRLAGVILSGHDGRRGYIYHMSVREDCRRQGIGARLTEKCLEKMKREGISKAALLVFRYNDPGNAFWESQVFTAREDVFYRNRALRQLIRLDT